MFLGIWVFILRCVCGIVAFDCLIGYLGNLNRLHAWLDFIMREGSIWVLSFVRLGAEENKKIEGNEIWWLDFSCYFVFPVSFCPPKMVKFNVFQILPFFFLLPICYYLFIFMYQINLLSFIQSIRSHLSFLLYFPLKCLHR